MPNAFIDLHASNKCPKPKLLHVSTAALIATSFQHGVSGNPPGWRSRDVRGKLLCELISDSSRLLICFLDTCTRHLRLQAGGSPAATHFSCLAKKSKPKKATEASLPPKGGPLCCKSKNGKCPKLASLRQRSFLNPFSASQQRHRHIGTAKSNSNPKVKNNVNTTFTSNFGSYCLSIYGFMQCLHAKQSIST